MTPENTILFTSFDLELRKLAFPQAMVQAGQRAMQGASRAGQAVAHGAGRAGAEALSGIPARMNIKGMQRSREQLIAQLERLEAMARTAKPPKKGIFQGGEAHQKALDEWAAMQEALSSRRQMLKQQMPVFEEEARRLAEHLQSLKQAPWTTPL